MDHQSSSPKCWYHDYPPVVEIIRFERVLGPEVFVQCRRDGIQFQSGGPGGTWSKVGSVEVFDDLLGGGFKHFLCSPLFGEDEPILTSIFFKWVETTN